MQSRIGHFNSEDMPINAQTKLKMQGQTMQGQFVNFQFTEQTYKFPDKTENVRTNLLIIFRHGIQLYILKKQKFLDKLCRAELTISDSHDTTVNTRTKQKMSGQTKQSRIGHFNSKDMPLNAKTILKMQGQTMQGRIVNFQFTEQTYKFPDKTENVRTNYAWLS